MATQEKDRPKLSAQLEEYIEFSKTVLHKSAAFSMENFLGNLNLKLHYSADTSAEELSERIQELMPEEATVLQTRLVNGNNELILDERGKLTIIPDVIDNEGVTLEDFQKIWDAAGRKASFGELIEITDPMAEIIESLDL